ncbi:MAG: hypothetical protein NC191_04410, partial [Muribaculaceae bacterium]|nr:hypothetical protein [Muribaculaceae bacterium]
MRRLKADEIECRVAQVGEKGFSLLLYKTARVDRAILDELYPNRWQNDFKVIDGKMYGGIGVYDPELKEWLWRWDCGTESNTEAEKGQASDCFKRAGFKWGIGVELYTAPFIWISGGTVKDEFKSTPKKEVYKLKNPYTKYSVKDVGYAENGDINKLVIVDDKGEEVYRTGKKITSPPLKEPEKQINSDADLDLLQGLYETVATTSAENYYKTYKDSAHNFELFKSEYAKHYMKLKRKENKQC